MGFWGEFEVRVLLCKISSNGDEAWQSSLYVGYGSYQGESTLFRAWGFGV